MRLKSKLLQDAQPQDVEIGDPTLDVAARQSGDRTQGLTAFKEPGPNPPTSAVSREPGNDANFAHMG
jgi:hypothetical protein